MRINGDRQFRLIFSNGSAGAGTFIGYSIKGGSRYNRGNRISYNAEPEGPGTMIKIAASKLLAASMLLFASAGLNPAAAEGDAKNGQRLFVKRCSECHFEFKAKGNNVGPNLSGVLGRKAGTFAGFDYSGAMTATSFVWSEALLLRFLTSPEKMVPGTYMGFDGLKSDKDRRDIAAYLKSQKGK